MEDQSEARPNRHTWHPDAPVHRRHPSYRNDAISGNAIVHSSKSAAKRLFSQSHDRSVDNDIHTFHDAENGYEVDLDDEPSHSAAKRQRSGEWPLPNKDDEAPSRAPLRSRPNSPKYPRRGSSIQPRHVKMHQRTSSFVEGSMNDRVSAPPPANYTDHEDRMDRYEDSKQESSRAFARTDSGSFLTQQSVPDFTLTTAKSDNQKPQMVRFGKNMFSVFNPTNWKLFSKSTKESKAERDHESVEVSQEAYQLHKASNAFKTHTTESSRFPRPPSIAQGSANSSARSPQRSRFTVENPLENYSGVDYPPRQSLNLSHEIPEPMTPKHEKRFGRVYETTAVYVDDSHPPSPSSVSQTSHISADNEPRKSRSSFSFKKPNYGRNSVSASDLSLPNSKKMPARKQIAIEQKLVKKISNLESQLEECRRQLHASIGEPLTTTTMEQLNKTLRDRPPVDFNADRPRSKRGFFTPTPLTTLPSVRILSDYAQSDENDEVVVSEKTAEIASGRSEVDVYSPNLHSQSVAHTSQTSRLSVPNCHKSQSVEPGFNEPATFECGLPTSQAPALPSGITFGETSAPYADGRSDSDVSSTYESVLTGSTVIHHPVSLKSVDDLQNGLAEEEEGEKTPKAEPVARKVSAKREGFKDIDHLQQGVTEQEDVDDTPKAKSVSRKISAKRKSFGDDDDDEYKPSKYSESDDDVAWDEAADYSTPKKSVLRNIKRQKTFPADSPSNVIGKKKSFDSPNNATRKKKLFDSPKGAFITSTKHPKRASVATSTPPKASSTDSPKGNFVSNTKFVKRTSVTPPTETRRKTIGKFPHPPSSSSFTFEGGKQAKSSTSGLSDLSKRASQTVQKRPISPILATASGNKISIQSGQALNSYYREAHGIEDEDAIPPVPPLSEEMLMKHRETGKTKQKKLTADDIHRQKKALSIGSSAHPEQDIARESIEKPGAAKSIKTREVKKTETEKKAKDEEFKWDDDVF